MGCSSSKAHLTILVIGLDNAGKSTLVGKLKGDNVDLITPTVGFSNEEIKLPGGTLNTFDLGGGENFRGIWRHYYAEVHGAIYVIDSTDREKLEISKQTLFESINDPRLNGKPLLIFANKQDKPNCIPIEQLSELLEINKITGPKTMIGCSAGKKGNLDENVHNGMKWLMDQIRKNKRQINEKIRVQVAEQKEKEKKDMEEKRKRAEMYRKEREEEERLKKLEEEKKKELPTPDTNSSKIKEKSESKQIQQEGEVLVGEDIMQELNRQKEDQSNQEKTYDETESKELTALNTPRD